MYTDWVINLPCHFCDTAMYSVIFLHYINILLLQCIYIFRGIFFVLNTPVPSFNFLTCVNNINMVDHYNAAKC